MLENQRKNQVLRLRGLMKMVDSVEPVIANRALINALSEESSYDAIMLFEALRERVLVEEQDTFDFPVYLDTITCLAEIADLSGQTNVAADLRSITEYFEDNTEFVKENLRIAKKMHIYQGLRENAENN